MTDAARPALTKSTTRKTYSPPLLHASEAEPRRPNRMIGVETRDTKREHEKGKRLKAD